MLLKHLNITTTIFFLSSIQLAFSKEIIVPIKKPTTKYKENILKSTGNFIIPQSKPSNEIEKIIEEIVPKIEKNRISKIDGIIPKNKPLIVKKQRSISKKSIYYSDIDLNYAKQAISLWKKVIGEMPKKLQKKLELNRYMTLYNGGTY